MIAYGICHCLTGFIKQMISRSLHVVANGKTSWCPCEGIQNQTAATPLLSVTPVLALHKVYGTSTQHHTTQHNTGQCRRENFNSLRNTLFIHSKLRGQNRNQVEFFKNVENYHLCTHEFVKLELYTNSVKCGFIKRTQKTLMETKFKKYIWVSRD